MGPDKELSFLGHVTSVKSGQTLFSFLQQLSLVVAKQLFVSSETHFLY